jgi:hypothetical protein
MKTKSDPQIKGKVLPEVTYTQKQFLKQSFKRIDFHHVSIYNNSMEINGEKIKLLPVGEFPEYTNEQLLAMPIKDLWELAKDFGFNPQIFGCTSYNGMMQKYGEKKFRARLKAYIYTCKDNHPVRCYAISKKTRKLIDLAKTLWTCNQLACLSTEKYNILKYTKPGFHLLTTLELR